MRRKELSQATFAELNHSLKKADLEIKVDLESL